MKGPIPSRSSRLTRVLGCRARPIAAQVFVAIGLAGILAGAAEPAVTTVPLDPTKANVIGFAPTEAKYIRLTLADAGNGGEPGLDEIEVYTDTGTNNLALAAAGAKATASSCIAGYPIHRVEHLNDGQFGNDHSWIAGGPSGWVQIELAQPAPVARVVVSRDRAGSFRDRMPATIDIEISGNGQTWRPVARVRGPTPPSKLPPPSVPVTTLADAVQWLESEAHRIIRASAVPMNDGTLAFPPQVGIGYDAFWLRDYEYALEGSIESFSEAELIAACRLFVKAMRADGAAVDCVRFNGTPIYKPGYGTMGREPVLDGPPFTVSVAWHTYRRTKDPTLLRDVLDPLVKTMNYLPRNPTNRLAHIAAPGERCPYGFTDSIPKSGDELFCSLLAVQASRQLGDLLEAGGRPEDARRWRAEADRVAESIRRVFWDDAVGLFRSTTGNCNVPDIWGSAFAVWLGVATQDQAQKIATYFQAHYDELVLHGQVRHMPGFMDWNGRKTAVNSGQYQSGGFWATPVGWFVFALDRADPTLADRTVIDMVRHFQEHGACEWINREGQRQLPGYTASAALPLEGIRAMLERRARKPDGAGPNGPPASLHAVRGCEPVGDLTAWTRRPGGLDLRCGERHTVRLDVLTDRLVRVRYSANGAFPASALIEDWHLVKPNEAFPSTSFEVRDEGRHLSVTTAQLRLELEKAPLRMAVFDHAGRLLTRETAEPGMGAGEAAFVQMERAPDEHFFGLGVGIGTSNPKAPFKYYRYAQFQDIALHGTQLEQSVITLDQTGKRIFFCLGPNWSGQCMTPAVIPFFMSTRGYGIYLNEFRDSLFDLGSTKPDAWSIALGGPPNRVPRSGSLDYYFLYGPSFKTILDTYTDLTGRTPLLPKWSLGYLQICHFEQKQSEVLEIARGFRARDLPCDMLLLEPGWMKTPYRMDGWSPERFPDPPALIAALRALNFRLGLWQCGPADWVFTSWDLFKRGVNQWGADITDPAQVEKYKAHHRPYYDQGIAFFKQDGCGQSEWQPDERYHNGLTGKEMHNVIPTLYSKIMADAFRAHTGLRTLNFNPMVGPSQQRYPGVWPSGDAGGGYDHFKGELNLGLCGHAYTTHDFTDRSPSGIHWTLLGPWCPGALSPIPEGDLCQFYLKFRYQLIPYLYSSHRQAHITGVPYLRAMVLEYQDDPVTYTLDRQCVLGDWFLLAAYTQDVYLPAGNWTDYWSGEVIESKGEWRRDVRWPTTVGGPLFVKGGAIVPMGPVTAFVDQEPLEIVRLDVYPKGDSAYTLYEDDGTTFAYEQGASATTQFLCRQTPGSVRLTVGARRGAYANMPHRRSYLLSVHCPTEPAAVLKGTTALSRRPSKAELLADGATPGWAYDPQQRVVWVKPAAGWYYAADQRGVADPEKDSVRWLETAQSEAQGFELQIDLPPSAS